MRRTAFFLSLCLVCFAAGKTAAAQAAESATGPQLAITTGGTVSAFHPDGGSHPVYGPGTNYLAGPGIFFTLHFTHWVQIEGDARWLRFHEYTGEHQDHYLIGPRVPAFEFGRAEVYGKALVGLGKMTFPNHYGYGTFMALAFGGGIDYKLSRKLLVRGDFEWQDWPNFLPDQTMHPWGPTVGIAYRVF
jgi:hypothetical protein